MGDRAKESRNRTIRAIRAERLAPAEREFLVANAQYEGSPVHKRSPGDFGLTPPASPRLDKTLCDEAGTWTKSVAAGLFQTAISRGVVSEAWTGDGFPKQIWVYDGVRVFEAMYGGSARGRYHGYPIRKSDPLFDGIIEAWSAK